MVAFKNMYIFLFLYVFLIIPALNLKFNKNIIYFLGILFLIFISYLRDPLASTDAENYFNAIDEKNINYLTSISPTFKLLISIFRDLFGFDSLLTLEIISLVPFICFLISAIILNYPYLLLIYFSSETFTLLSYNGIRQGLSIGFLMLTISILIKNLLTNQKITKLKNLLSFKIPLIISFTSHVSSLVISLLFLSSFIINKFKKSILKYKIKKNILFLVIAILLFILGIIIFRPGILNFIFVRGFKLRRFGLSYLVPQGFGYNQNHFSAIYRFLIMFSAYIYAKFKLKKIPENNIINKKLIGNFLDIINLSYLPLIIICLLQNPTILSRTSHFYIISLSFSVFFADKIDKNKRFFNCSLISIMGLIAYSSSSVINNLISQ